MQQRWPLIILPLITALMLLWGFFLQGPVVSHPGNTSFVSRRVSPSDLFEEPLPQPGCSVPVIENFTLETKQQFKWLPFVDAAPCPGSVAAGVTLFSVMKEVNDVAAITFRVTDRCQPSAALQVWAFDEIEDNFFSRRTGERDALRISRWLRKLFYVENYRKPPAFMKFKANTTFPPAASSVSVRNITPPYIVAICDNMAELHTRSPLPKRPLVHRDYTNGTGIRNVLHMMFDSASLHTFRRTASHILGYFRELQDNPRGPSEVFPFHRFHTVHCCSPGNQIPAYTGLFSSEGDISGDAEPFPESRNWIWNEASELGYRTFFFYDLCPEESARDFHAFPYVDSRVSAPFCPARGGLSTTGFLCAFNKFTSEIALEGLKHFWKRHANESKFAVAQFITSHERTTQNLRQLDGWVAELFREMEAAGSLDDTAIVLWSDHGLVFGPYPSTPSGMTESRLPFLYVVLPRRLVRQDPGMAAMLRANAHKLTTAFDLHAMTRRLLHYPSLPPPVRHHRVPRLYYRQFGTPKPAVDLTLEEVPGNRTCEDANIPSWACTCYPWVLVSNVSNFIDESTSSSTNSTTLIERAVRDHRSAIHSLGDRCHPVVLLEGSPQIEIQKTVSNAYVPVGFRNPPKYQRHVARVSYKTAKAHFMLLYSYREPGPHVLMSMNRLDPMKTHCGVNEKAAEQMCVCNTE